MNIEQAQANSTLIKQYSDLHGKHRTSPDYDVSIGKLASLVEDEEERKTFVVLARKELDMEVVQHGEESYCTVQLPYVKDITLPYLKAMGIAANMHLSNTFHKEYCLHLLASSYDSYFCFDGLISSIGCSSTKKEIELAFELVMEMPYSANPLVGYSDVVAIALRLSNYSLPEYTRKYLFGIPLNSKVNTKLLASLINGYRVIDASNF